MQCSFVTVLVMDKNQTAKEGFESVSDAVARLLERLEQTAKKRVAGHPKQGPAEIQKLGRQAPSVGGKTDEVAAVSAYLIGLRGLGDDKAVLVSANDNHRFRMTRGNGDAGGALRVYDGCAGPARLYSDDNATPKIARMVTLRGSGEF